MNFDRYENQINKIGKTSSGALSNFAINTLEEGYRGLAKNEKSTLVVLEQQSKLAIAMDHSKYREFRVAYLMKEKLAQIQPKIDDLQGKSDSVNAKIMKLNNELSSIQEPIKRLTEEKLTV